MTRKVKASARAGFKPDAAAWFANLVNSCGRRGPTSRRYRYRRFSLCAFY